MSNKLKNPLESGMNLYAEAWLRFKRNKLAMLGLIMVVTVLLSALFANIVAPYPPMKQLIWTEGVAAKLAAPGAKHLMGTDLYGRDILSRVLFGARISLQIGIFATVVTLLIGIPLGAIAGYRGGFADDIISWLVNVIFAFPFMLFVLAVVSVFKDPGIFLIYVAIGVVNWVQVCRVTRGQFISLRGREFVEAAHALGLPQHRIIFRHILPNVGHIVMITLVLDFSGLVLAEAVLSYVNIGVDPTMNSWGNMINSARLELARDPLVWWSLAAAFLFMFTLVLAANLFADVVRDAFDPRLRAVR